MSDNINPEYVKFFDDNPQFSYNLHIMTGSQLHYALKQKGINDNTINPNQFYNSKITQDNNGVLHYHRIGYQQLLNKLNHNIRNKQLKVSELKHKILNNKKGKNELQKQNKQIWNRNNYYINRSGEKNKGIGVKQFNEFSSHKAKQYELNKHQNKLLKKKLNNSSNKSKVHDKTKDIHNVYADNKFAKGLANTSIIRNNVISHAGSHTFTSGLKSIGISTLVKVSPILISGLMVAKQLKNDLIKQKEPTDITSKSKIMAKRQWRNYVKRHRDVYQSHHIKLYKMHNAHNIHHTGQQRTL